MSTVDAATRRREIDRPLGQSPVSARKRPLLGGFELRDVATGVAAVLLAAASGAIAFRDQPFRTPVSVVTVEPQPATASAEAEPAPAPVRSRPAGPDGPALIQVNPESEPSSTGTVVIRDPSALGQNLRVAHLPDKALIEDSDVGPLPIRAADGRRPFDVYARPWSGARGARVAIVIGGLGVSQTGSKDAIEALPAEVTLAFASGGNSLGRWMQAARQGGHEVVMQIPLEPFDYPDVNPGRNTLTVDAGEENIDRLHWSLSRITNYTGVMNYMGARFTADSDAMAAVMAELGKRGLAYLDDGSSARSVAADLAARNGVPYAEGEGAIDAVRERGDILKKLDELEATARAKGYAIGTGSAFDVTIDAVASWVAEAKKRGIEIVPFSAIASDPERK